MTVVGVDVNGDHSESLVVRLGKQGNPFPLLFAVCNKMLSFIIYNPLCQEHS